jgi:LPPG:FO 2-phospho-L-lactate transferase
LKSVADVTIAVSPIVKGKAVKGPAAKIMQELGIKPSAEGVARHYRNLIEGFVFDQGDAEHSDDIAALGMATCATATVMRSDADRVGLARDCLDFIARLLAGKPATAATDAYSHSM